jgi:ParB-like chromosome segregation protein Spo0J
MSVARGREISIDDPVAGPTVHEHQIPGERHSRLRDIPLEHIRPNPGQPRKRMDQDSLCSLAESIGDCGVLQPVIVRRRDAGGYDLIAGERRWRAARIAGAQRSPPSSRTGSTAVRRSSSR